MMQLQHRVRFSLKDLVRTGTVRLIDRSWLNARLGGGGALMRLQDLPETTFLPTSIKWLGRWCDEDARREVPTKGATRVPAEDLVACARYESHLGHDP